MLTLVCNLPAGEYIIVDACYVIDKDDWSDVCNSIFAVRASNKFGGKINYKDQEMVFFDTAYGDGTYFSTTGEEFGVDAGIIACIPVEVCDQEKLEDDYVKENSLRFTATDWFECTSDTQTLVFNGVTIPTA